MADEVDSLYLFRNPGMTPLYTRGEDLSSYVERVCFGRLEGIRYVGAQWNLSLMAQQTLDNDPKIALQNGIDQLKQFAAGERVYVFTQGITSAMQTLEGMGMPTDSFKAQITPELMTGVIRRGLSQLFDSLSKALSEFEGTDSNVQQVRIANLSPNFPDHINAHAALAARYDISVSDLFPRNFDQQLAKFEVLWERREHSYGSRGFQSQLAPLLDIAFPRHDMSELRMPRLPD